MTKPFLSVFILLAFATVSLAQRQSRGGSAPLVKKGKPAVFISFLRSADLEPLRTGYGRAHLIFGITNNTRWPIWLQMNGVPKEYGDAGLFYTIEETNGGKIRIDSRCHVCSVNPVGPGRSVVFSIPRDYAARDVRLRVAYSFTWERDNENEAGSYSTHSVEFYFENLPKSVLPAEALSNTSLQVSRDCVSFIRPLFSRVAATRAAT